MKVEIRCASCSRGYLVDAQSLGGELSCPACSRPIVLPPDRPPSTLGTSSAASRQPEPAALLKRPVPVPPTNEPVAIEQELVCPRCNLHFKPHGQARSGTGKRRTVLVVEDMNYFRQIAEDALAPVFEVKTAASVGEAEAVLARGGIDLMILDLTLEGGEEGRRLLPGQGRKSYPILIYTAQDESEMYGKSWQELQKLGADDIVIKGMHVGESLVRKVSALLGGVDAEEAIG